MKASQRGANNIRQFNAERETRNIFRIREELKKIRRLKLEFKSLGKLADYLGSMTGIHRTTLVRNVQYKTLMVDYFAATKGYLESSPESTSSPAILQAKLLASRLDASNLRQQIRRLELYASNNNIDSEQLDKNQHVSTDQDYVAFVDTAMALTAVLERMQDTVVIDLRRRTIEDLAAPPSKKIIIGPERTTAYITWLREQQGLLLQFSENNLDADMKP